MGLRKTIYRVVRDIFRGEPEPTPEKYARRIVDATDAAISDAQARLAQIRRGLSPEQRDRRRELTRYLATRDYVKPLRYVPPEQND